MSVKELNYSSLSQRASLRESLKHTLKFYSNFMIHGNWASKLIFGILPIALLAAMVSAVAVSVNLWLDYKFTLSAVVGNFVIYLLMGVLFYLFLFSYGKRLLRVKRFAEANKFDFIETLNANSSKSIVLGLDYNKFARNGVKGIINKVPFIIYDLRLITSNARWAIFYSVVSWRISKTIRPAVAINKKSILKFYARPSARKYDEFKTNSSLDDEYLFYGDQESATVLEKIINSVEFQSLKHKRSIGVEVDGDQVIVFQGGTYKKQDELKNLISVTQIQI